VRPELRTAAAGDLDRLTTALAAAFQEDPVFGWLMPDRASRPLRLRRFFKRELHHVLARGHVWTSADLGGAALTLPPGRWRTPQHVALRQARPFGLRVPRAAGLLTAIEWRHLRAPHYYFPYIGVMPAAQGRGLGSAMMRPILDRCDAERLPAYLEASSERNARLYERLGFTVTRELRFAGSPPLRLMVRQPGATGVGFADGRTTGAEPDG
jgi:ribosomal protein S18 acetylase RimI-like enzyme